MMHITSFTPQKKTILGHRKRYKQILLLALPITLGMLSQNLMSLVDTFMIGKLGSTALAAVGIGGFVIFLCHAITLGMSTGVQSVTSQQRGKMLDSTLAQALNSALLIMFLFAPVYSLLLFYFIPHLFPLINPDPQVLEQAIPYSQARFIAILFVGMNFAFRGYLASTHMLRVYLIITIFMHLLNVLLNYLLIYGNGGFPELGVEGAGIASTIATAIATLLYFLCLFFVAQQQGFLRLRPTAKQMRNVLRNGLPYGMQQTAFAAGFTSLYWIIGQIGTNELAAATVVTNLTLFVFLPGIGLSIASATLIGQAYGAQQHDQVRQWARDVSRVGLIGFALFGAPFYLIPELLLSIFIQDTNTLLLAKTPLQLAGLFLIVEAFGLVLTQALYATGNGSSAMCIAITLQWLIFLPLVYFAGPVMGLGLTTIWILQISYRTLHAILITRVWLRHTSA